jgi:hypothetical protein
VQQAEEEGRREAEEEGEAMKAITNQLDCGCAYDEAGGRVQACAGHRVGNVRIASAPQLQRARRLTSTPAAGEARSPRGRDWEAIGFRFLVFVGVSLFWMWIGMLVAR